MSNKKKHAQAARRQVRTAVGEYEKTLFAKIDRIRVSFKPKPRFFPFFLWAWLTGLVIDLGGLKKGDIKDNGNEIGKAGEDKTQPVENGGAGQEHPNDSENTNQQST